LTTATFPKPHLYGNDSNEEILMHHQRQTKSPYLLALCGFLLTASAGVLATPDEHASAQVSEAVQSALARLIESGDVSAEALEGLHVDIDSFRTARFGALIEGRFTAEEDRLGVRVLAVADASAASQMGLRKGDRIQAVAGTSLLGLGALEDQQARAAQVFRQVLAAQQGDIELLVERDGQRKSLHASIQSHQLPALQLSFQPSGPGVGGGGSSGGTAVSTCGRVSQLFVGSRSRAEFPLVIIAVDGQLPGPTRSDTFRVDPGLRRITLAEAIDPREFSDAALLRRSRDGMAFRHDLQLEVLPGMTYRLAARFQGQVGMLRDNSYWQPVVVSEKAEACR
jgi:hypothetical protein